MKKKMKEIELGGNKLRIGAIYKFSDRIYYLYGIDFYNEDRYCSLRVCPCIETTNNNGREVTFSYERKEYKIDFSKSTIISVVDMDKTNQYVYKDIPNRQNKFLINDNVLISKGDTTFYQIGELTNQCKEWIEYLKKIAESVEAIFIFNEIIMNMVCISLPFSILFITNFNFPIVPAIIISIVSSYFCSEAVTAINHVDSDEKVLLWISKLVEGNYGKRGEKAIKKVINSFEKRGISPVARPNSVAIVPDEISTLPLNLDLPVEFESIGPVDHSLDPNEMLPTRTKRPQ